MLVLNLPFKALMFLTLMRPSLVLFLVLWLKLVKDLLKVRCMLALLPFLISCLIWLDLVSWIKHSVDRFVIVSIFIPKLRLILILNSFLGSSDSLVFSELFHSLAPRPLAARSISDFLLTFLAT